MQNQKPSFSSLHRTLVLGLAVLLCLASVPLFADGGVTFNNIAAGAGITYHTVTIPYRQAIEDALYQGVALPHPSLLAETPQKPRGAPGVALFDYDNDGDLDIYVTNGAGASNSLYQSQFAQTGQVSFVDVATAAGVGLPDHDSTGVCYGDVDNDGDADFYVTGIGEPNVLFRNDGNGTFTDITGEAGVGGGNYHRSGCAFADFNGDGQLDILVGNTYDDWRHRKVVFLFPNYEGLEPNQLFYRKAGAPGIQFEDVSATSGINHLIDSPVQATYTWAVSAVDYDQDGDTDVIWADTQGRVNNDPSIWRGYNRLFVNDGTGHFTDRTVAAGMKLGSWMGLSYGDYNCDGAIDFFSTNLGAWIGGPTAKSRWFLGDGHGNFLDPGVGSLIDTPFGWGTSTADYDNDGDQDIIYFGDDDVLTIFAMDNPGSILQNQGCTADFHYDLNALTTDHRLREVNGVAMGDLDKNGFEDIVTVAMFQIVPTSATVLARSIGAPINNPLENIALAQIVMAVVPSAPNFLTYIPVETPDGDLAVELNSGGNGNNWAAVRLIGGKGVIDSGKVNRDGVGAVLKFTPEGGKTIIYPIVGGGSHVSQDDLAANFGLGTASQGTLDILWPGGAKNRFYGLGSGESLVIPEIPCSLDGNWKSFGDYNSCVRTSLNGYLQKGVIDAGFRQRLIDSAVRAFNER